MGKKPEARERYRKRSIKTFRIDSDDLKSAGWKEMYKLMRIFAVGHGCFLR